MHQSENPPAAREWHRRPFVILIVVAIVLVGVIIWIGNWALEREKGATPAGLTDEQKAAIEASLRQPTNIPPLTDEQKAAIEASLRQPTNIPPLTDEQKARIADSLEE